MGSRSARIIARLGLLFCALALAAPVQAQRIFGQNKVVYEGREWLVYEDGMLQIYFYPAEEELAVFTLDVARETYDEFAEWFGYEFTEALPIILYPTHHDLKQTHVIPSFVSEGTAGFTEFIKGRIAIRGTGNRAALRHLIRHEMVHAFMLSELATTMNDQGIYDYEAPPLWFIEGLAESLAREGMPTAEADLILRDAALNDGLVPIPQMWRIWGSFQMYKQGESILDFMRQQYGDDAPALLLDNWYLGRDFRGLLQLELGLTVEELDRVWRTSLKRRFYPQLLGRRTAEEHGKALDADAWFDTMPAVAGRDSTAVRVATVSARKGTIGIWDLVSDGDPWSAHRLVEAGREARFETIPILRSRLDVADGRWLAFVAKHGATDHIFVYDLEGGEIVDELWDPDLVEISSPTISPDLDRIAFSALSRGGTSDLYVFEVEEGTLLQITDDPFEDIDCAWHPSGDRLVFASDRGDFGGGTHSIYEVDAFGNERITPLVTSAADDTSPRWTDDGTVLGFLSDREGTKNLYRLDGDTVRPLTNLVGGIFGWDFVDADAAVASIFERRRFRLFELSTEGSVGSKATPARLPLPPALASPAAHDDLVAESPPSSDYDVDLELDFVQSVVALDPDLPYGTGASFGFSDLLGSHQVYAHVSSATSQLKLVDMSVGLSYSNFTRRWARHIGIFRVAVRPRLSVFADSRYSEVRTGGFAGVTYPFSRYRRIEISTVWRRLVRDETFGLAIEAGNTWLGSLYGAFVHDNTLWDLNGPRRGWRWNVLLGETVDVMGRGFDRSTFQFDWRHYSEFLPQTILALRGQWRASFGGDSEFFYLGGPNTFRGVDWFSLRGERTLLGNVEVRFPLVDHLSLGFPFGGMSFPPVRGAIFHDTALITAASGITSINAPFNGQRWLGSLGGSFTMTLFPPLVVRTDFAKVHNFEEMTSWRFDFSLSYLY
jgi:hypothetical protein